MRGRSSLLALLLFISVPLAAQDVTVKATIDSSHYLIGQWIYTHLDIRVPKGVKAELPSSDQSLESAEFVSAEFTEETEEGGEQRFIRDIIITAFDTGRFDVRVLVSYRRPGDTTTYVARSNPLTITMSTVELDTSIAFRDIRDVMHVSLSLWDYLIIAGIALLLVLIGWYAWRRWKRRPIAVVEESVEAAPEIPPHVLARKRLESLEQQRLWQAGKHKEYQSGVTDTVREYIGRRFHIPAMEEITSEIISDLALAGTAPELVTRSEAVLRLADQTKFARYIPTSAEHEATMRYAYDFVDATAGTSGMTELDGPKRGEESHG